MMKRNGFTLFELLIVLSLLSIITLIAISLSFDFIKKQQTKHFLELLHSDIFFVQNQSFLGTYRPTLNFRDGNYVIIQYFNDPVGIVREYPAHITFRHNENNKISFKVNGNYEEPKSIRFNVDGEDYKLTFPFGKGRGYVE